MSQPSAAPEPQQPGPGPNHAAPSTPGPVPPPDHRGQDGGGAGFYPPPPGPVKKSPVVKIVVAVLVAVVLLGGLAAFVVVRGAVKTVADATNTRVVAPDTLNGRPKSTEPELQQSAQSAADQVKAGAPSATSVVSAFYGTPDKKDLALLVAVSSPNSNPQAALDALISEQDSALPLTGMHEVDPGPLGGVAKCGAATTSGIQLGVCVWVDGGSSGYFYSYFASADRATQELVTIRQAVEQKG